MAHGRYGNFGTTPLAQGLEKPVIILSTAVTRPGNFVGDAQRLNVALTRAKHHLIVVSASSTNIYFPTKILCLSIE